MEEPFALEFNEWFDRGTPSEPKEAVRARILAAPEIRGYRPKQQADGSVWIDCWRAIVRGVKPL